MSAPAWLTQNPIAHRGYHDLNDAIWENTMPAFRRAIDCGFAIECDIRLSADGVPIVFHDDDLTRLCGLSETIEALDSAEISTIPVGTSAAIIPTYADLLETCAGRVPLVVELKPGKTPDPRFVPAVIALTERYSGAVALMSFSGALMAELRQSGISCPLGLTAEGNSEADFAKHRETLSLGLDFVSYYYDHLNNDFIAGLRQNGITVITWTVRDERARTLTFQFAEQMTFEGFDPRDDRH